jgi:hypothetical protein
MFMRTLNHYLLSLLLFMVGYVSLFAQAPPEVKAMNGIIQVKVNRDAALRIGNVPRLAPSSSSVLKTGNHSILIAVNSKVKGPSA